MSDVSERLQQAADELGVAIEAVRSAYRLSPAEMLMMVNVANGQLLAMLMIAEKQTRHQEAKS